MSQPSRREFTVEQANRTLPLVRRIVEDIVVQYRRWLDRVRELEVVNLERTVEHAVPRAEQLETELQRIAEEIDGFISELRDIGVEVARWDTGLVDFPTMVDGRPALLSWRLGEPSVEFFHRPDDPLRLPLTGRAA